MVDGTVAYLCTILFSKISKFMYLIQHVNTQADDRSLLSIVIFI